MRTLRTAAHALLQVIKIKKMVAKNFIANNAPKGKLYAKLSLLHPAGGESYHPDP
ncbi:hypothetical protein [Zooshikella sp. RANM57]|uniref:hypothetical protein n=1 Tax=Zooshikella sp. RANM57 TaxID=3425863 RepID=UPI003D6DEA24